MLAYALSSNTWWAVAFIAAVSVLTMMGMIAKILNYELTLIRVVASARIMRNKLQQSIAEAEAENNPESAAASQALQDAKVASIEDPEDVEQSADEESSQDEDESSSDEDSAHEVDLDSPEELASNVVEVESTEEPETAAAA